jgi:hypothetical protein
MSRPDPMAFLFSRLILLMLVPLAGCAIYRPSVKTVLFQVVDASTRKPLSGIEVSSSEGTHGFFYDTPDKDVEWGKTDTNGEIKVTLDWNLFTHYIWFSRKGCLTHLLFFENFNRSADLDSRKENIPAFVPFPPKQGKAIVIPYSCEETAN